MGASVRVPMLGLLFQPVPKEGAPSLSDQLAQM